MKKKEFLQAYDDLVTAGRLLLLLYLENEKQELFERPKPTLEDINPNKLYTRVEAAEFLGVTPGTLSIWACTGRYNIPYSKVGSLVKYKYKDLEAFLHEREQNHTGYFKNQ